MVETVKMTEARRSLPLPLLDRPADLAARVAASLRVAIVGGDLAAELVAAFLAAEFSGAERYRRRLEKIEAMEREGLNV